MDLREDLSRLSPQCDDGLTTVMPLAVTSHSLHHVESHTEVPREKGAHKSTVNQVQKIYSEQTTAHSVETAMPSKEKQGASFLFCLCDMRRAVIMLDALAAIGGLMAIVAAALVNKHAIKKEEVVADMILLHSYDCIGVIVIQTVGMLCHFSGIFGAIQFQLFPLVFPTMWEAIYAVLCGIDRNWAAVCVSVLWLYPHAFLCRELAQGIMTKDNYNEAERQSCCCV